MISYCKEKSLRKKNTVLNEKYDANEMEKALTSIKQKDERIKKLEVSRKKQVGKCEKIQKELENERKLRGELEKKLKNIHNFSAKNLKKGKLFYGTPSMECFFT